MSQISKFMLQKQCLCIELLFTGVLAAMVWFSLIHSLWDQTYLDYVIEDWSTPPIIDLKAVKVDVESTQGSSTVGCPEDYEAIVEVYFPGTRRACQCGADNFTYGYDCDAAQEKEGCTSISPIAPGNLQVINNIIYCAKRDASYNLLTIEKPSRSTDDEWSCASGKNKKLCGNPGAATNERLICIPTDSECPVTHVTFDARGYVSLSYDSSDGLPVVHMVLTQGNGPCIYYHENYNKAKDQVELPIMEDGYNQSCPNLTFGDWQFRTQKLYKEYENFPGVSEATIYKQNRAGQIWYLLNETLELPEEEQKALESQMYHMYQVNYHPWSAHCVNPKTNVTITKHVIEENIYETSV